MSSPGPGLVQGRVLARPGSCPGAGLDQGRAMARGGSLPGAGEGFSTKTVGLKKTKVGFKKNKKLDSKETNSCLKKTKVGPKKNKRRTKKKQNVGLKKTAFVFLRPTVFFKFLALSNSLAYDAGP